MAYCWGVQTGIKHPHLITPVLETSFSWRGRSGPTKTHSEGRECPEEVRVPLLGVPKADFLAATRGHVSSQASFLLFIFTNPASQRLDRGEAPCVSDQNLRC